MRRVAGQEDPALLEPLGPLGARVPLLHVLDLDRQVRRTERLAHVLDAALVAHVRPDVTVAGSVGVGRGVDDEEAGVAGEREAEEPLQRRPEHVDHAQVAIADERLDVGAEVDRDAVREARVAAERDAQPLADGALAPVRGDDVLRAHGPLLHPCRGPGDDRCHAVLVLVDGDELRRVLEARAELVGVAAEDRLEPDLGDEQPWRRAQRLVALVDVAEVVLELAPGQASRPRRSRRPARTRGRTPRRSPPRGRGSGRSRSCAD